MTSCKRGDIVLVPFPFTDLTTIKQRPALVISSTRFNAAQEDVIVVAITSNVAPYRGKRGAYHLRGNEQRQAGLPKEGIVRANKIVVVDQRLIRRTLGSLPKRTVDRIVDELTTFLR